MATLINTDFTGLTNGTAWPAPWTSAVTSGSGAIVDVQNTSGRLVGASGSNLYIANHYSWSSTTSVNWDLLFDLSFGAIVESYFDVNIRSVVPATAATFPTSGYFARIMPSTSQLDLNKWNSTQTWTQLGTTTATMSPTFTANQAVRFRLQAIGSTVQIRYWTPGATEPSTWAISATDATVTASGTCGWLHATGTSGSAVTAYVDNILATDNGIPTPTLIAAAPPHTNWTARMRAANW